MHSALRLTTLLATATATLAATAATASAGQLVYSYEPSDGDAQIRVMNDDGTHDRLLVHEDDIPGAEAVYSPYVSPDGATVVFQARTPAAGAGGLYCGFRCSGIYAYSGGEITRISQDPIPCPPGDLCFGLDTTPRITGGGDHVFYELLYGEPGGQHGTPQTIRSNHFRSIAPGDGGDVELPDTSCGKGSNITPNPAVDGEYAISAYCSNGNYGLKIAGIDGGDENLVYDDHEFADPAFRGDGQVLVSAEDGGDPGLWTYTRDGSSVSRIAALSWDSDHRPFNTSPTFVGTDRVAFLHGESIRTVSTSCQSCSLDQTSSLGQRTGIDGVAWTSQNIPDPAVDTPQGGGGGGGGGAGTSGTVPKPPVTPVVPPVRPITPTVTTPATLKAPAKAKLAAALRSGIAVPFVATRSGRLTMEAVVAPAQARKLGLARGKSRKPVVVATGVTTVSRAGAGTVTLRFTKAAKRRLKRARSVPLTLRGSFAGTTLSGRTRLAK
jgi:hypothetical protein